MFKASPARIITYLVILLTLLGLLMVGNASSVTAFRDFGDKWHYFKSQSVWTIVGLTGFFILRRVNPERIERLALPLLIASVLMLVLVLIPGIGIKVLGARRWLNFGFATFQPSELAKLSLCVYLAALLKNHQPLAPFLAVVTTFSLLVMFQPDLGTTLILVGICASQFISSGGKLAKIVLVAPLAAVILGLFIFTSPYRTARLKTYLNHSFF